MSTHRPLEETDIMLIKHVKATPSLYDPRNSDFRMAHRKEEDWTKVALNLNIDLVYAKRRWTCLRDRYSRELKQLRLHPNRAEYAKNDFFRQMDFLREFVRKRRERSRRDESISPALNEGNKSITITEQQASKILGDDNAIEDNQLNFVESSETNFKTKLSTATTSAEAYSMIVEETHEPYEDYTVPTGSPCSSNDTKNLNLNTTILKSDTTAQSLEVLMQQQQNQTHLHPGTTTFDASSLVGSNNSTTENEDDFFCKSIAAYLRQLSRRHKIKAKVEIYQILEKYIELEENNMQIMTPTGNTTTVSNTQKG